MSSWHGASFVGLGRVLPRGDVDLTLAGVTAPPALGCSVAYGPGTSTGNVSFS